MDAESWDHLNHVAKNSELARRVQELQLELVEPRSQAGNLLHWLKAICCNGNTLFNRPSVEVSAKFTQNKVCRLGPSHQPNRLS